MNAENQAEAFQSDPILSQLTQSTAIRYSGCLYGQEAERRQNFIQSCNNGRLHISIPSNGINLDLILHSVKIETNEIIFESNLIFNGVCVKWKGRINKQTLTGNGKFEFDAERAAARESAQSESLRPYRQRLENIRNLILQ
uniref:PilZ domain-containing protein n=1 Tax=Panagrolaimus sp. PS1159 TaxID=55785 RepID=A0AC35FNG0_9BILA